MNPPPQSPPSGWITARPPQVIDVLQRLVTLPRRLVVHRDLITTSVKRDLEARFTGTVLGWVWPLIHPLFLFVVYYFIFTKLLDFKIPDLPPGQESALGVYMFCGIMSFATISEALLRGTNVFIENGNLLKKLSFPAEILPLNVTLVGGVTHSFALIVFLLACALTPIWPAPGLPVLWIPVILLLQLAFTYGLTLILSTLQVFLRDTAQVVGIVTTVWMFITPLFWVPEMMGASIEPYLGIILANPIYHLVMAWRGALMGDVGVTGPDGRFHQGVSVEAIPEHLATFAIWAVILYGIGYALFVLSERRFADEV